jgi:hypothetical protein
MQLRECPAYCTPYHLQLCERTLVAGYRLRCNSVSALLAVHPIVCNCMSAQLAAYRLKCNPVSVLLAVHPAICNPLSATQMYLRGLEFAR